MSQGLRPKNLADDWMETNLGNSTGDILQEVAMRINEEKFFSLP